MNSTVPRPIRKTRNAILPDSPRGTSDEIKRTSSSRDLLFAVSSFASTFKVVYSFSFTDGSFPNGDLIRDAAGNLYGTTQFGGKSNRGLVFKLDAKGKQTVLYTFTGASDGGIPIGRLLRDTTGNLYGITALGGDPTCSCGTVFKLAKNGSLKVLHNFKGGKDGAQNQGQPELGLVMVNGDLYGSASFGGVSGCDPSQGCGVIFKLTQAGKETVLHRFTGQADGAFPQDLINDSSREHLWRHGRQLYARECRNDIQTGYDRKADHNLHIARRRRRQLPALALDP